MAETGAKASPVLTKNKMKQEHIDFIMITTAGFGICVLLVYFILRYLNIQPNISKDNTKECIPEIMKLAADCLSNKISSEIFVLTMLEKYKIIRK